MEKGGVKEWRKRGWKGWRKGGGGEGVEDAVVERVGGGVGKKMGKHD